MRSAALVLCNDKPQTYGAPDVLQFAISDLAAAFSRDAALADRPPNQARGRVSCRAFNWVGLLADRGYVLASLVMWSGTCVGCLH